MKIWKTIAMCCTLSFLLAACNTPETPELPAIDSNKELVAACAHIEGGGAGVMGGDGGSVYRVNRLDDAPDPNTGLPMAGTLRYAVTQSGARRVVFTTSGTIHLTKELRIKTGNLTIDGQSAPGDGICIADYPLIINASNVIVRFIRIRLGDVSNTESDAVSVNNSTGVVLDHLSCSWSVDECVSCYGNTDFTMQYCIISESLKNSVHGKGSHGYGGIWGGTNASFHHNLLAHHDSRNPRFDHDYVNATCAGPIDYVNNVVYNWGGNSAYGGEGSSKGAGGRHINFVKNYYKPGPATSNSRKTRLLDPTVSCSNCADHPGGTVIPGKFYLTGNIMHGSDEVTADNWKGSTQTGANVMAAARWTDGLTLLKNEQTAEEAYATVLAKAGCSLVRDEVDTRIIDEVSNGTYTYKGSNGSSNGLIDTQSDVGSWPALKAAARPLDTDYDFIPDDWETQFGLDPDDPDDARAVTLVSGHTNLDVYMCHLVRNLY
ncbi:MAG: pectate lyase [Paludibacteraceae bacterium]|nr:pectate lyase [Paludibacteraceae bacterium]